MSKLTNAAAEQRLVGSCLNSTETLNSIIDRVAPGDFEDSKLGTVFSAAARVAARGELSATAVIEELRFSQELDLIGGDRAVTWLSNRPAKDDEVVEFAKTVHSLARRREQAIAARAAARTIEEGGDPVQEIAQLNDIMNSQEDDGWTDLGPIVDAIINGTHRKLEPTILTTTAGNSLIYPNRLNMIMGQPESMKSWTGKLACVQQMMAGNPVVYIDCEESDGITCSERIYAIALGKGVTSDQLEDWVKGPVGENGQRDRSKRLFFYKADTTGFDGKARSQVLRIVRQHKVTFAVFDGFAAAMSAHNPPLEEDKARDVGMFLSGSIWPIVNAGAGVLVVDHVAKSSGNQAAGSFQQRGPRGSGHKLSAVSGVALQAHVVVAGSSWSPGRVELRVSKDRVGRVRVVQRNNQRLAAVLVSTPDNSTGIEVTKLELLSPEEMATQQAEKRWDLIAAEKVSKLLTDVGRPMSKTEIKETLNEARKQSGGAGWRADTLVKAIDFLLNNCWARLEKDGRIELIESLSEYKADFGDIHCDERPAESPF
jgi:hypothetical protein